MGYLVAALLALALITAFNTFLCFAVIRRLRASAAADHGHEHIDVPAADDSDGLEIGRQVDPFAALDTTGATVTDADVHAASVIAFLSSGCPPCQAVAELLPRLHDRQGDAQVLAFVNGSVTDPDAAAFARRVAEHTRTVFFGDPAVANAFGGVDWYPMLVRVEDGVVTAAGSEPHEVGLGARIAVAS